MGGTVGILWRKYLILFGFTVSVIGMGTVLFALVLLMGIIKVLGHFTALTGEAPPVEEKKRRKAPRKSVFTSPATVENTVEKDEETAVVIAAALAACLRKS
jgi:sodium pump decarboxylase gamma subunit